MLFVGVRTSSHCRILRRAAHSKRFRPFRRHLQTAHALAPHMDTFLTRVGYKKLAVHKKQGIDWTPKMTDLLSHSPRAVLGPFACDQAVRHASQIKVMLSPGAKVYDAKIPPGINDRRDWSQFRRDLADLDRTWERVLLRHDNGVTNGSAGWSVDGSRLTIQYQGGVFGTISLRSCTALWTCTAGF